MQPNPNFLNKSESFWAYAKLISEKLKYSSNGSIKTYQHDEIVNKLNELQISIDPNMLNDVMNYLNYRTDILNSTVKNLFWNVHGARDEFKKMLPLHAQNNYKCALPLNKQRDEKRDYAYFTCMINILAEKTLREYATENNLIFDQDIRFDSDPRNLTYFADTNGMLQGIFSRRFDGALPSVFNPIAIWEIKEYYYTTTFGSRIADGVYETQLDGFENKSIFSESQRKVHHIYFIDDYNTWWNDGKSYLCRIFDMMNSGLVDEVIFGKEILTRWPILLRKLCSELRNT